MIIIIIIIKDITPFATYMITGLKLNGDDGIGIHSASAA